MANRRSVADRFWSRVDKPHGLRGCWFWTGPRNPRGYGQFSFDSRVRYAHRVSFELNGGVLQGGLVLMHLCDNPPCVNPLHLAQVPIMVNVADGFFKRQRGLLSNTDKRIRGIAFSPLTEDEFLAMIEVGMQ